MHISKLFSVTAVTRSVLTPPSLSFLQPETVTGGEGVLISTESVDLDKFYFYFLRNNAGVRFYGPNPN